jgi:5'-3' exonuclease
MGIPAYFSHIIKKYNKILQSLQIDIDNLYLDSNSIIYDAFYQLRKDGKDNSPDIEKYLIENTCKKIDEYIKTVKPSKRVIIAFDGIAPVAKLEQQRIRRHRTWFTKEISNSFEKNNKESWSTSFITPGTQFMDKLNKYIINYYKNSNIVIVSGSNIPGEGEHKIFEYIRTNNHKNQNTLVYGLDADLIMLCLNHLSVHENLFLFRETPEFVRQIDSNLDPNKSYMLNIPELAKAIINEIHLTNNNSKEIKDNRIKDYIFLCFFLGNDFLPHFPALNIRTNGIDILLDVYKNTLAITDQTIIQNDTIIWKNLRSIIQKISIEEHSYFLEEHDKRKKKEKRFFPTHTLEEKLNKLNSIPSIYREDEIYINPDEKGWEYRYYKRLFDLKIDDSRRKQICTNYLEGIEWTFKYYIKECYDWKWKYKYNYPPLLSDLIEYIPYFDTEFIPLQKKQPVQSQTQLIYVLPYDNLYMLNKETYNKISHKLPKWYNNNYQFTWAYCKYFWESHIHLPEINIDEVEHIISS